MSRKGEDHNLQHVFQLEKRFQGAPFHEFLISTSMVLMATFITIVLGPVTDPDPFLFFFVAVLYSSWLGGLLTGLFSIVVSVLGLGFISYFYAYRYTPVSPHIEFRLLLFILVGIVTNILLEERKRRFSRLRESNEILKTTLEGIQEGAIVTDSLGFIAFANVASGILLGKAREDMIGKKVDKVVEVRSEETSLPVLHPVLKVLEKPDWAQKRLQHSFIETEAMGKFSIEDSLSLIKNSHGEILGVLWLFRDISREKLQHIRERFLSRVSKDLVETSEYEKSLKKIVKLMVPQFVDWCSIDVIENGTSQRISCPSVLKNGEITQGVLVSRIQGEKKDNNLYDEKNEYVITPGDKKEQLKRWGIPDSFLQEYERASYVRVPLRAGEKLLGHMVTARSDPRKLTRKDVDFIQKLGVQIAFSLQNTFSFKEAQKAIRTRDEFLAVASHELKTPLTSLILQIQRALRDVTSTTLASFSGEKLTQILMTTEKQSRRIAFLIEDLLHVSVIASGRLQLEPEQTELSQIIDDLLKRYQVEIEQSGSPVLFHKETVFGRWDKIRLEQVVANLLINALKYGQKKPITITVRKKESQAELLVKDEGIGIEEEKQHVLFQPFERAVPGNTYKGTGLGLYIINEIVKAHGGKVEIESAPNKGSTFTVTLPLVFSVRSAK
ncbi:MAG TPA: ATP-binding protein [Patescibacteria group bacterium]|nr:ATP-binding protein [Patescibacteria group bacterium]